MKKMFLTLTALALAGTLSVAAPTERIFVSTDRSAYLAGDAVWCSLTCLDENGLYSNASAISYVELVSEEGTACTAKIGLLQGRGAGSFRIPVTTPTGDRPAGRPRRRFVPDSGDDPYRHVPHPGLHGRQCR